MADQNGSFEIEDYDDGDAAGPVVPSKRNNPGAGGIVVPGDSKPSPAGSGYEPADRADAPAPDPVQIHDEPAPAPKKISKIGIAARLFWYYKARTIPVVVLLIIATLLAVPSTRYPIVGTFLRRHYDVRLLDSKTKLPVSGAVISLGDKRATTDAEGRAKLSVRVGQRTLGIEKKYYKSASQPAFVGISGGQQGVAIQLMATGRQVPITVLDKVSGKPVVGADVRVIDTGSKTDKTGTAIVVLPATQPTRPATIKLDGYNTSSFTIQVTDRAVESNTVRVSPSGRIYFLSNASGSIDVVSSNMDGTDRKTVVQGTGNEDANTRLYVSPSLKYLALYARRDASRTARLHAIDAASGTVRTMDSALATFDPVGWAGDDFIYTDERQDLRDWQSGRSELKSYSPVNGNVTVLDKNNAEGTNQTDFYAEDIRIASIVNGQILYGKTWSSADTTTGLANKQNVINRVQPNGKGRQTLRSIPLSPGSRYSFMDDTRIKPRVVLIQSFIEGTTVYYAYQNNTVNQSNTITYNDVTKAYPDYYVSPSGSNSFWSEVRDGKTLFFTGDNNADDPKQVAELDGYAAFGWYGNDYLLVSKNSQLYVIPAAGLDKKQAPLKVSNYFVPTIPR